MNSCQTVPVSELHQIRLHEYRHRHKFHVKPHGWNAWGKIEMREIMEVMKLMVEGEEGDEKKIFFEHPQSTWENYFSGDQIMNWICGNEFGATIMFRRDRLPGDIES